MRKDRSYGLDGSVGRNPLLPCTTKRRITTNLISINNQKLQKIKLHRAATTKELKKKSTRTTRPVRIRSKAVWAGPAEKNHREAMDWTGRWGWLKAKPRPTTDCGLWWGLPPVGENASLT